MHPAPSVAVPSHKETLHGAYLTYTQGDAHENPMPEKGWGKTVRGERTQGRKENPGEEKTQGRKHLQRKCPLVQQTPALSNSNGAVARKSAA